LLERPFARLPIQTGQTHSAPAPLTHFDLSLPQKIFHLAVQMAQTGTKHLFLLKNARRLACAAQAPRAVRWGVLTHGLIAGNMLF
jgi:hypothetical protein